MTDVSRLAAEAAAISSSSAKIKAFAIDEAAATVDLDKRLSAVEAKLAAQPAPTPPPTPSPTPSPTPPAYSAQRWVYPIGDPLNTTWQKSSDPGWGWPDANGHGQISTGQWNRRWGNPAGGANGGAIDSHVQYDNTDVQVMGTVVGYPGSPGATNPLGTLAACPTVKLVNSAADPGTDSTFGQAAYLRITDQIGPISMGFPSMQPHAYETWWYGFAFNTNVGFQPQPVDNFNVVGLEFHRSSQVPGLSVSSSNLNIAPKTTASPRTTGCFNGAYWGLPSEQTVTLGIPKLLFFLNGGDQNKDVEDSDNTSRSIYGPDFVAGQRVRIAYKIIWSPWKSTATGYTNQTTGAFELWASVGATPMTQLAVFTNVATMFRNGSVPDPGIYVEIQNYRRTWGAAPQDMAVYVGGFIRGSSMYDVTIP